MNSLQRFSFHRLPIVLPLAGCVALASCQPASEENAVDDGAAANEAAMNLPSVPRPDPPIDRAALLNAVAQAASAAAAGVDDAANQRDLDGKPFQFRIRFGCRGPSPDLREAMFGWTVDRETKTLRVKATPTISSDEGLVQRIAGEDFEAVEGFWVPRPWLLEPICPAAAAVRPAPAEAAPEPQPTAASPVDRQPAEAQPPVEDEQETESPPPAWPKVGLAQFFTDTDPRTRRRGTQPYETVKTLDPARPISSQGFNLVISGRLRALPGQGVIACESRGADTPPDCIISARIDRVRVERPDNGEILADWGGS